MLILMTALFMTPQAVAGPEQSEVVVIGQKLRHWTGKYAIRGNRLRCSTKSSSGDCDIDNLGCKAFDLCADQLASKIAATDEKSLPKEVRLSMTEEVRHYLSICIADKRAVLIEELARQREGVRGANPS